MTVSPPSPVHAAVSITPSASEVDRAVGATHTSSFGVRLISIADSHASVAQTREPFLALLETLANDGGRFSATVRLGAHQIDDEIVARADIAVVACGDRSIVGEVSALARLAEQWFNSQDSPWSVSLLPIAELGWANDGHAMLLRQPTLRLETGGCDVELPVRFRSPGPHASARIWDVLAAHGQDIDVFVTLTPTSLNVEEVRALESLRFALAQADISLVQRDALLAADPVSAYRGDQAVLQLAIVAQDPIPATTAVAIARCFTAPFETEVGIGHRHVIEPRVFVGGGEAIEPVRDSGPLLQRLSAGLPWIGAEQRRLSDLVSASEWSHLFAWPVPSSGRLPGVMTGRVPNTRIDPGPAAVDLGLDALERPTWISDSDRRLHLFNVAGTGAGKTTLLARVAGQDLRAGRTVVAIDSQGDLLERVVDHVPPGRRNDVVYLDCDTGSGDSVNLLQVLGEGDAQVSAAARAITSAVTADLPKDLAGPVFNRYAVAFLTLLGRSDRSLRQLHTCFSDQEGFVELLKPMRGSSSASDAANVGLDYWGRSESDRASLWGWVESKFDPIRTGPGSRTLCESAPGLPSHELFGDGRVLLVHPGADLIQAQTVTSVILSLLLAAAKNRRPDEPLWCVYLDEIQRCTGRILRQAMNESRKRSIALHLATQNLSNLADDVEAVIGNAGTVVVGRAAERTAVSVEINFGISADDVRRLASLRMIARLVEKGAPADPIALQIPVPSRPPDGLPEWLSNLHHSRGDATPEIPMRSGVTSHQTEDDRCLSVHGSGVSRSVREPQDCSLDP